MKRGNKTPCNQIGGIDLMLKASGKMMKRKSMLRSTIVGGYGTGIKKENMLIKKALIPVTIIVLCLYLLIVSIVRSVPF